MISTLLALALATTTAWAATTCNTDLQPTYPYCISIPDGASSGTLFPTVLFLSGRGARGPPSNAQSLATYDGFGKLVSEYNGGNKDEAHTLAATKFIVIVPVAPEWLDNADPQYWYNEKLSGVLDHAKSAGHPIDWDRFHVSGYSMGAFGSWRFAVNNPSMLASIVTSGGNAETNSITNTLGQTATAPADLLAAVIKRKIPMRAFTGTGDSTIPMSWLEQTQSTLERLGAGKLASLTVLDTDHGGLSTIPFSADLLSWMLQQKRPGSGGKAPAATSKSKSKGSKATTTKTKAAATPKSTSAGGSTKKKCTPAQRAKRARIAHARALSKQHGGL